MTQLAPSNLVYSQIMKIISDLKREYTSVQNKAPDEIVSIINKALTEFESSAGKTLSKYEPITHSEIPDSEKLNRFWQTLQTDINVLQQQVDLLRAAGIFTHNFIKTEINKSKNQNRRLLSKLKTLEMYSGVSDDSIVYFGDTFISDEFIDTDQIDPASAASILGYGYIGLGVQTLQDIVDNQVSVKILPGSNGFPGNNQEIHDPISTSINPITGDANYIFKAEMFNTSSFSSIVDSQPNSWFEFEKYYIDKDVRSQVQNYNFHYQTSYLTDRTEYISDTNSFQIDTNGLVNWANGFNESKTGILRLNLQVDLGSVKPLNLIKFTPYGLDNNRNNPLKVKKIIYSSDGTNWFTAGPENVWIANSIDRRLSTINSDVVTIGEASWVISSDTNARYIRLEIEQPNPIQSKIGHLFYLDSDYETKIKTTAPVALTYVNQAEDVIYDDDLFYDSPLFSLEVSSDEDVAGPEYGSVSSDSPQPDTATVNNELLSLRRLGPNPIVDKPTQYYTSNDLIDGLIQKREYFEGLRWAIGIRDIEFQSIEYKPFGYFTSNELKVAGVIDRVALEADIVIPDSFDKSTSWIQFFISPDKGITWYPISRIQDSSQDIPEVIAFNDPTPAELREAGVKYIDTADTVESLKFKAEFYRPEDIPNLTPILKSYKLKIKRRT